jgi:glutaredoxin 3
MSNAKQPEILMYKTSYCPYCVRAKRLLVDRKGMVITEIDIEQNPLKKEEMLSLSGGRRTVPQIFINGQHIGGCDDLEALEKRGDLDKLLLLK